MLSWWVGALLGGGVGLAGVVAALRRRYLVVTVDGSSMVPTFHDGDRVIVRRGTMRPPLRDEIVVFRRPPIGTERDTPSPADTAENRWNIKRIVAVPGDPLPAAAAEACRTPPGTPVPAGQLVVFGDGPASLDSRAWGYLPADQVLGVMLRSLQRSGR